ncbi:hypothetical protein QBC43DRAFT_363416 [Cladorrhinum sp. PSN259]|nr:hypothetical protein QBC43DRAFT_363416 [Cladorrhinum sp. PSN259]
MICLGLVLGVFASHVVVAASSGVMRPRQYWGPDNNSSTPTPQECVEISFTEPAWGIYDPALTSVNASSGGTQGDIRFLAINSATRVEAACRAQNIELEPTGAQLDAWHNCSIPDLQFQFILSSFEVKLRGSWSCDNSTSSLVFSGNGSWEEPIVQGCLDEWDTPRGQETLCIMGGSHVAAGLSSPIPMKPQAPYIPFTPSERPWRCVDRSWDPEWQVNELTYTYTLTSYNISLNITNMSSENTTVCSATVIKKDLPTNGSFSWVNCTFPNGTVALELLPEPSYNVLGVRQSWSCWDGVEGVEPAQYSGVLFLTPPSLTCTPDQESQSQTCSLPAGHAPLLQTGYADVAPHMPHTSYANPSCTISSISNLTSFTLNSWSLDSSSGSANFSITNPGPGDTYHFTNLPVPTTSSDNSNDDGEWRSCLAGENIPWQLVACKYSLSKNKTIKFEMAWYCDDRDPSNSILFTASTAQTPLTDAKPLLLPVSNLTYQPNRGVMDRGPTLPWI